MKTSPEMLKNIKDACKIVLLEDVSLKGVCDVTSYLLGDVCLKESSFLIVYSKGMTEIKIQLNHGDWYYDLDEPTGNEAFLFAKDELKVRALPCGNIRFVMRVSEGCMPFIGIYQPFR